MSKPIAPGVVCKCDDPTAFCPMHGREPTTFTVRTNRGWGWRVVGAPECPSFGSSVDAQKYADLRTAGVAHLEAWDKVESERTDG